MQFADLSLSEPILRALIAEGYTTATPIQAKAIPIVLEGHDVMGCAQTGTGKTAAFALPILHRLHTEKQRAQACKPLVLVLCPTRELATQIADGFHAYGANVNVRQHVIFGGVNQRPQADAMRRGIEVCIATPGRLLDLVNQRLIDLRDVHTLVLDEADRMLDMGFINDIKRIVSGLSKDRQTLMFSATMPREIRELSKSLLRNPISVEVAPVSSTADNIDQSVYFVDKKNKPLLLAHLYNELPMARAIVFTRTKHGADKVVIQLHKRGIRAEAIHGNKSQNARQRALANFKSMKTPVLVATDIAARGIDVDGITHVVNYDVTHEPETYVHRIGRTARAGATGAAVSFCDRDERGNLRDIERLIKKSIRVADDHPAYPTGIAGVEARSDRSDRPERSEGRSEKSPRREQRPQRDDRPSHPRRDDRPQQRREEPRRQSEQRPQRSEGAPQGQGGRPQQQRKPHQAGSRPLHAHSAATAGTTTRNSSGHPIAGGKPKPKFQGKPRQRRRF